ncbi:MAG: hypothetical protein FWG14_14160 [Peptococcaceae bacterium]|nr:hypothetical protein [Peptococcaceae bacterium]
MNTKVKPQSDTPREHRPIQSAASARAKLVRMGLLDNDGSPDIAAMTVLADIYCSLFFDDLRTLYDKEQELRSTYNIFAELFDRQEYNSVMILLAVQHDFMFKPLPDPVCLLVGDPAAVDVFISLFMDRLTVYMAEAGYENEKVPG